jgi:hypothetical protein
MSGAYAICPHELHPDECESCAMVDTVKNLEYELGDMTAARDRLKAERDEAVGLLRQLVYQASHYIRDLSIERAFLAKHDAAEGKR